MVLKESQVNIGGGPRLQKNKDYKLGDWKKDHCKFVDFSPGGGLKGVQDPDKLLTDLQDQIAKTDVMAKVLEKARDEAMSIAFRSGAKLVAKAVATKLVPVAGWIYSAATAADDIAMADYYIAMYDGAVMEHDRIMNDITSIKGELQSAIDSVKTLSDNSKTIDSAKVVQEKLANWQRTAATVDPCLRARKCKLESYNDAKGGDKHLKTGRRDKGCCDGQTGHHLVPDAFVKNAECSVQDPNKKNGVMNYGKDRGRRTLHMVMHLLSA